MARNRASEVRIKIKMNINFDAVKADLVDSLSHVTAAQMQELVMDPWIELRAEIQSVPLAA